MNPLRLQKPARKFYEALVALHHADVENEQEWLAAFRHMKSVRRTEGESVIPGWRIFYSNYFPENAMHIDVAEKFVRMAIRKGW